MEPVPVSHRAFLSPLVVLIKRLVRKSVRWYVAPQLEMLRRQIIGLQEAIADIRSTQQRFLEVQARLGQVQTEVRQQRQDLTATHEQVGESFADLENEL